MEEFLDHMLSEVNKQRHVLEAECVLLKNLLKPWPRKKKSLDDSEAVATTTTQEIQNVADNFSPDERQALSQVDKLLRKAEQTRNLKPKIKQDVRDGKNMDDCNIKKIDIQNHDKSESVYINHESPALDSSPTINRLADSKRNAPKVSNHHVPSPKTGRSLKKTSEIQSSRPESGQIKSQKVCNNKNSSATTEINKDSKHKSSRPSSSTSNKPSSGTTRHVPAHMLAPFKTSDNVRLPKHRKNLLIDNRSSTRTTTKISKPLEVKTYKTLPDIVSREYKRSDTTPSSSIYSGGQDSEHRISHASNVISINSDCTDGGLEDDHPEHMPATDGSVNCSSTTNLKSTRDTSSHHSNSDIYSVKTDEPSQILQNGNLDSVEPELHQFNLQNNGSSLKLPGKLLKLVNANRSLHDRLSPSTQMRKACVPDTANLFMERLCAQEEVGVELKTYVSALTCLRSHQILLDMLQDLQLVQLSENTSTEVLYRAKRILEFVLTTFAELQEDADYFSKVKYRRLPPVLNLLKALRDQEMTLWLDAGHQRDNEDGLWNHLQTSRHWAHLYFTQQYLELNINLVKTAQAEWWDLLKPQERNSTVLQGVYGLLTTHGQFLPALVENPDLK